MLLKYENSDVSHGELETEKDNFVRIEEKYLVSRSNLDFLLEVLENALEPSYPIAGTKYTLIESVYFDSVGLDIFKSHFHSRDSRFKIRTRKYAPNGIWPAGEKAKEAAHLELKIKEHGVCKKSRFQISPDAERSIKAGKPLSLNRDLEDRNPELKTKSLSKRVDRVNTRVLSFGLKPSSVVTYNRIAYEKNGLRVTIDQDIQTSLLGELSEETQSSIHYDSQLWMQSQNMREQFHNGNDLVLEIKHSGSIPIWVTEMLKLTESKKASFSKYVYSIAEWLYLGELKNVV